MKAAIPFRAVDRWTRRWNRHFEQPLARSLPFLAATFFCLASLQRALAVLQKFGALLVPWERFALAGLLLLLPVSWILIVHLQQRLRHSFRAQPQERPRFRGTLTLRGRSVRVLLAAAGTVYGALFLALQVALWALESGGSGV